MGGALLLVPAQAFLGVALVGDMRSSCLVLVPTVPLDNDMDVDLSCM
jgi:hypothetical protein